MARKLHDQAKEKSEKLETAQGDSKEEDENGDEALMKDLMELVKGKASNGDKNRMEVIHQLMELLRGESSQNEPMNTESQRNSSPKGRTDYFNMSTPPRKARQTPRPTRPMKQA